MAKATICVFGKPPRPGEAKTRLIPVIGAENAARLARALLEDAIEAASRVRDAQVVISATAPFQFDDHQGLPLWIQPEGDLGVRLEATLRRALGESPCALAVGADTPGLTPAMLEEALEQLQSHAAVLGPSQDGGYYLIGLKTCPKGLFGNIRWSRAETLNDTVAQLKRFGISHSVTLNWFDLDTQEDLNRVRLMLQSRSLSAPRLASVVHMIDAATPQSVI